MRPMASRFHHPHHPVAIRWLEVSLAACGLGKRLTVLPMVAAGFLPMVAHPRVFVEPTPLAAAQEFLAALLAVEGVVLVLLPLSGEWPLLEPLCRQHQLVGNAISDGWIAASSMWWISPTPWRDERLSWRSATGCAATTVFIWPLPWRCRPR
jgi:predicted nucleic acid-binding protein